MMERDEYNERGDAHGVEPFKEKHLRRNRSGELIPIVITAKHRNERESIGEGYKWQSTSGRGQASDQGQEWSSDR